MCERVPQALGKTFPDQGHAQCARTRGGAGKSFGRKLFSVALTLGNLFLSNARHGATKKNRKRDT